MKGSRFFNIMLLLAHAVVMFDASAMLGARKGATAKPTTTNTSTARANVVSVDIGKVIAESTQFQEKRKEIEDDLKGQAKPIEDLQKKIQEKQEKLQKGAKDLSKDAKTKLEKEVADHSKEHMMHAQGFQMKAQAAEQKFVESVQARVKEVAKTLGYDIIVFPGASILANDDFDKTQELINKLNALHTPKKATTAKKPAKK